MLYGLAGANDGLPVIQSAMGKKFFQKGVYFGLCRFLVIIAVY
jgi:hypothetical protein